MTKLNTTMSRTVRALSWALCISLAACAPKLTDVYHDANMDFGSIRSVAVMPFVNQTREPLAADRVRDVFMTMLLSSGAVYVIPAGEVSRGVTRTGIGDPTAPSPEEVIKFGAVVKSDVVITGTVREYGEVRSGTVASQAISLSMRMIETQTGKVVWSASSTKGGVSFTDRLLGGGGAPMNEVTEKAVNAILDKLFK